jgi:hypothetical protein
MLGGAARPGASIPLKANRGARDSTSLWGPAWTSPGSHLPESIIAPPRASHMRVRSTERAPTRATHTASLCRSPATQLSPRASSDTATLRFQARRTQPRPAPHGVPHEITTRDTPGTTCGARTSRGHPDNDDDGGAHWRLRARSRQAADPVKRRRPSAACPVGARAANSAAAATLRGRRGWSRPRRQGGVTRRGAHAGGQGRDDGSVHERVTWSVGPGRPPSSTGARHAGDVSRPPVRRAAGRPGSGGWCGARTRRTAGT